MIGVWTASMRVGDMASAADIFVLPEPSAAALRLYGEDVLNWALFSALGLLFPVFILWSGASARLRDVAERTLRKPWLTVIGFYLTYRLLETLFFTPFSWARRLELSREYGRTTQTTQDWLVDRFMRLGTEVLMVAPLVIIAFWLVRRYPRRWWALFTAVFVPYLLFVTIVDPLVIQPRFVEQVPLAPGPLREKIEAIAAASGIEPSAIVVEKESVRSKAVNAGVSGIGPAVRIAFTDNMLAALPEPQILFVMAHELGHHRHHHIWQGIAASTLLFGLTVFLLARFGPLLIRRNERCWRVRSISDVAALPLALLIFSVVDLLSSPLMNTLNRAQELQADAHALLLTGDREACAKKLASYVRDMGVPDPYFLEHFITSTHPSHAERAALCRSGRVP